MQEGHGGGHAIKICGEKQQERQKPQQLDAAAAEADPAAGGKAKGA